MTSSSPAAATGNAALHESLWQKVHGLLLQRRVRITVIVFVALLAEDAIERVDPHNLVNFRDYRVVLRVTR